MEEFLEVREQLRRHLRLSRLRPEIWIDLVQSRYPQLVRQGRWSIETLASRYSLKEELYPRSGKPRSPRPRSTRRAEAPAERQQAVCQIVAEQLDRFWLPIEDFRNKYLDGQYLPYEGIAAWIRGQAEREGPPATEQLAVPISAENRYRPPSSGSRGDYYRAWLARELVRITNDAGAEIPRGSLSPPPVLSFPTASGGLERCVIRGDGPLGELKALVETVTELVGGWDELAALTFILTERIPLRSPAISSRRMGLIGATARIILELDPRLAPREVERIYAHQRRRFVANRDRPLDRKHFALAVFTERSLWGAERDWVEVRGRWNATYPKWHYRVETDAQARVFSAEARNSWMRVTGDRWPWERPRRRRAASKPAEH